MTKKFIDISDRIEPFYIDIFDILNTSITKLGIPYFIVGATARDFILKHGFDIKLQRMTVDIDLAVRLDSWEKFINLKMELLKHEDISITKTIHRLRYKDSFPIDIVPFGAISNPKNIISWPPENEVEFNTFGFDEAYQNTFNIKIRKDPELFIDVVDLTSLTLLKLISYSDRSTRGEFRDAIDLAYLFDNYLYCGNQERLFNNENHIIQEETYDTTGVRLLGKDLSKILSTETRNKLIDIINKEINSDLSRLITKMVSNLDDGTEYEKRLNQLKALKKGLLE